jgi:N-acetylglutamate synthase-like GNAT family acetyltransferase
MNWGLGDEDFEFMTKLEPEGCFVLLSDFKRIGMATAISFGKIGWFGNVIVDESMRGRGGGSFLVKHIINYLKGTGVETIGIYGYHERIPFYQRHGFKYDSEFTVLKGKNVSVTPKTQFKTAEENDLQDILFLDELCFGTSRYKLLKQILQNPDNLCYLDKDNSGQLQGYIMAKIYNEMAEVGPLVCKRNHENMAIEMLKTTLCKLEGLDISIYLPAKEKVIQDFLNRNGFHEEFGLAKMFHGPQIINDYVYIAESLERG